MTVARSWAGICATHCSYRAADLKDFRKLGGASEQGLKAMSLAYPNSLPLNDIALLISDIKNGTFSSDAPRAVKAVWELAGYAAFMAIGEPSAVINPVNPPAQEPLVVTPKIHMALQSAPTLSSEQIVEYLELFLSHAKKDLASVVDLPWLSILKWAYAQLLGAI